MSFVEREIRDREVIIIMQRAEAEEREAQKNAPKEEATVENKELELLREELEHLLGEMMVLNTSEPVCTSMAALKRWEARRNLLKEQISVVETEIAKLDDTFDVEK